MAVDMNSESKDKLLMLILHLECKKEMASPGHVKKLKRDLINNNWILPTW